MSEPERHPVRLEQIEVSFDDLCWFFAKAIVAFVLALACLAVPVGAALAVFVYAFNEGNWPFV